MAQIRVDWALLVHGLNILKPPFNDSKNPEVQPWSKLVQRVHSMLLSMPSLCQIKSYSY
jgi:hypothetical protein